MADVGTVSRRRFLALGGLGAAAGLLLSRVAPAPAGAQTEGFAIGDGHSILPRDVWGADLPPTGEMEPEAPEDVRFLLVHHSASPNDYAAEQSIRYLRSFYRYHTSAEKGWPDIAYNFLVDRHGQIFEGRHGSLESPVRGDATGGSQGFALLACFIGDHREVAPTPEAQSAMVALLAWLADTYEIDPRPDSKVEFISRGSNLHPEGATVVTPTITGHRTMSRTTCPGDQAFELVKNTFPQQVTAALPAFGSASASATTEPSSTVPTTQVPTTSTAPLTSEVVEPTRVTLEVASDAGSDTVSPTTEPAAPTTTEPYGTSTPASSPVSTEVAPVSAIAADSQIGDYAEAPTDRSRRVHEMVWAGLGTAVLGAVLWLRRRADLLVTHERATSSRRQEAGQDHGRGP